MLKIVLEREGYRYRDLVHIGLVASRSDLHRKQTLLGFPRPIKIGLRNAWFPRAPLEAWIEERVRLSGEHNGRRANVK